MPWIDLQEDEGCFNGSGRDLALATTCHGWFRAWTRPPRKYKSVKGCLILRGWGRRRQGFGQGILWTCFIQVRRRERRQFLIKFWAWQSNRGGAYLYPVTAIRWIRRSQALQPKRWDLCDSPKVISASWAVVIEVGSIWCQGSGVWSVWGSCPRLIWRMEWSVYLFWEYRVSFVFRSWKWLCIRNQSPVGSFALLAVFLTLSTQAVPTDLRAACFGPSWLFPCFREPKRL